MKKIEYKLKSKELKKFKNEYLKYIEIKIENRIKTNESKINTLKNSGKLSAKQQKELNLRIIQDQKYKIEDQLINSITLKKLLFGKPSEIIKEVGQYTPIEWNLIDYGYIEKEFTKDYKALYPSYNTYRNYILDKFNISVCPYCNRNFHFTYKKNNKSGVGKKSNMFQLDHFYPQMHYPYLALNIYNFIPSCGFCNHTKLHSIDKILNPHEHSFDDYTLFELSHDNVESMISKNKDFEIKLNVVEKDPQINAMCEKTKEMFMLEEVYKNHKREVKELILRKQAYNESFINDINNMLKYNEVLPNITVEEFLYGASEDINNKPLSKLSKDIIRFIEVNSVDYDN